MNDHQLAASLAHRAGELLVGLRAHSLSLPQPTDDTSRVLAQEVLGKVGDTAAHDFLIEQLAADRPHDDVLSEEGEDVKSRLDASRLWIVDPLDGTRQYGEGRPDYAVHVALWESSAAGSGLTAGAVAVPEIQAVWSTGDNGVLQPVGERPITIVASRTRPPRELDRICSVLQNAFPERGEVDVVYLGSVGAKVAHIISGHADLYINTGGFFEWDLAAPLAVAEHYGLQVVRMSGAAISFNQMDTAIPDVLLGRPEFVAVVRDCLA